MKNFSASKMLCYLGLSVLLATGSGCQANLSSTENPSGGLSHSPAAGRSPLPEAPPVSAPTPSSVSTSSPAATTTPVVPVASQKSPPQATFDYARFFQDQSLGAEAEHDFGLIVQGKQAEHIFTVTNYEENPIAFGEVRSDLACCLVTEIARAELGPGESTELKVTLNSAHQGGPLFSTIVIPVAGRELPLLYRVTADVEEVITAEPYVVVFGPTRKATVRIKSKRFASGLKILKVESDNPKITSALAEKTGTEQLINLNAVAVATPGAGYLRFLTSDAEIPDLYLHYEIKPKTP
jgi:hypothetical protein